MKLREDKNMQLMVELFMRSTDAVPHWNLWTILEIAYEKGHAQGIKEMRSIINGPKREQEARESELRG